MRNTFHITITQEFYILTISVKVGDLLRLNTFLFVYCQRHAIKEVVVDLFTVDAFYHYYLRIGKVI